MNRLIGTWVLIRTGMLDRTAKRLTLQDDPGGAALFEIVSDLHPTPRRAAGFGAKLDLGVCLIPSDRNAAHVHVHGAHIECADRRQVLQDSGADRIVIIHLLLASG